MAKQLSSNLLGKARKQSLGLTEEQMLLAETLKEALGQMEKDKRDKYAAAFEVAIEFLSKTDLAHLKADVVSSLEIQFNNPEYTNVNNWGTLDNVNSQEFARVTLSAIVSKAYLFDGQDFLPKFVKLFKQKVEYCNPTVSPKALLYIKGRCEKIQNLPETDAQLKSCYQIAIANL
jgi:hypothetical protein